MSCEKTTDPVFVNIKGAQESIPKSIPQAYVAWWAGTSNSVVVPTRQAGNRFLGSLKDLQIRAQEADHGTEVPFTNSLQIYT